MKLPFPKIQPLPRGVIGSDVAASLSVVFLGLPQGMAYATIAELPPAAGLFAAAIPAIIGSLMRSSRHVVAGPSNALSLLVGGTIIASTVSDPVEAALCLALMVGLFQASAGLLRLGALVDYISTSVVLGYITGAGVLIGIGQLYNALGTSGPKGRVWVTLEGAARSLPDANATTVAMTVGTVILILALRFISKKVGRSLPSAVIALAIGLVVNLIFGLEDYGLRAVHHIAPIPLGLPPITMPDLGLAKELIPGAIACAVLSLIESNAVARSIAARTGQRLDASTEFFGQGLANIAAAFTGGYPISGSLSRSALNEQGGAKTRLSGMLVGLWTLLILLVAGPVLDHTPMASLAGLLLVLAFDLVDRKKIRVTWGAGWTDRLAFLATMIGTWSLPLDQAIYLGIGVSFIMLLRKASGVVIREIVRDDGGIYYETVPVKNPTAIRVLEVQGTLFFATAAELSRKLESLTCNDTTRALIIRLRSASGLDATVAFALAEFKERVEKHNIAFYLVGVRPADMDVLRGTEALDRIGAENVALASTHWLAGLDDRIAILRKNLNLDGDVPVIPQEDAP